jgi:hypothetical protein
MCRAAADIYKKYTLSEECETGLANVRVHLTSMYTTFPSSTASGHKATKQLKKLEAMFACSVSLEQHIHIRNTMRLLYSETSALIKSDPDSCQACGKQDAEMVCACDKEKYCDVHCQARGWPEHKRQCTAPAYLRYLMERM